jgi:hypothetical protein
MGQRSRQDRRKVVEARSEIAATTITAVNKSWRLFTPKAKAQLPKNLIQANAIVVRASSRQSGGDDRNDPREPNSTGST